MASTPRPSACPGLLRIVAARDGGICRIKLPGGRLSAAQAEAVAAASARHAAGVIELTNRANLQLRGVLDGHQNALIAALLDAGLGPLPADGAMTASPDAQAVTASVTSAADDVRNVMISPAAGRDPAAVFDTTPLCAGLLAMLQGDARFAALSPKFALLLDGGERLARVDHPHDVWLAASQDADGVRFVFGLAGCPPEAAGTAEAAMAAQAAEAAMAAEAVEVAEAGKASIATEPAHAEDAAEGAMAMEAAEAAKAMHAAPVLGAAPNATPPLAAVLPSQVPALVRALLHTFLDLAADDATRMRHLLASHSVDAVLQHAQTYTDFPLARDASYSSWRRTLNADATLRLGAHPQREPDRWHAGGQPPLGRVDAATLAALAALAREHNGGTLHVTPWQSVLLPDLATAALPAVLAGLNALGLACEPSQAISRLIACTGSSGCAKSPADTKADALQLAARLPAGVEAHLSGCTRSCAAAHCAPYTLLAVAPGRYDLYRRDDGGPGFGQRVAHQLTIQQAADTLERLARSNTDA